MNQELRLSEQDLLLLFLYAGKGTYYVSPTIYSPAILGRLRCYYMFYIFEKEIYKKAFKEIEIEFPNFRVEQDILISDDLKSDLDFFSLIKFVNYSESWRNLEEYERLEIEETDTTIFGDESDAETSFKGIAAYSLTSIGEDYVNTYLWEKLTPLQKDTLLELKKKVNSLSLETIIEYFKNRYIPNDVVDISRM